MPFRELLEEYPLYRKYEKCSWYSLDQVPKPTINMSCPECSSGQTFVMENEYHEGYQYVNVPLKGLTVRVAYLCVGCRKFRRYFFIHFSAKADFVMKVGQEPPWTIAVDKNLERMLGDHAPSYRKGLVCESQGYGIGAFAYYRRIVEQVIDSLLVEIERLIPEAERAQFTAALAKAKTTKVAADKIALVKDLLPGSLRPDGLNPLSVLHDALSEGIHSLPDERCIELAEATREALVFLVNEVMTHKTAAKSFTDSMRKLLDRKA